MNEPWPCMVLRMDSLHSIMLKAGGGNSEKSQILKMSLNIAKMARNVPNILHETLTNIQNITIYKLL